VGNAASKQFQLDVYGEVMDSLHLARAAGLEPEPAAWRIQVALLKFLEACWQEPDEGIWEIRGPRLRFSARIVPPWASTTRLLIASPSPLPRARRVQNVSKIRSRSVGAMAGPSFSTHAVRRLSLALAPMVIPPSAGAHSSAFSSSAGRRKWRARVC